MPIYPVRTFHFSLTGEAEANGSPHDLVFTRTVLHSININRVCYCPSPSPATQNRQDGRFLVLWSVPPLYLDR